MQRLCVDFGGYARSAGYANDPRAIDAPIPPHPQGDAVSRRYP